MSRQRTPLRSKSSMSNFLTAGLTTPQQQTPRPRVSMTELRKPPSGRTIRPSSPRQTRSRPGSAMGSLGGSRPSTPSSSGFGHNEPYSGSISVSVRPNPHSASQTSVWKIDEFTNTIFNNHDSSSFQFDNVFAPHESNTNRHVYNRSCSNIVQKFMSGSFNGTVFAYGMTGSGKTFSMKGDENEPGFVRLAIEDIYNQIESDAYSKNYVLSVNYLEIYNEKIIDLLNATSAELKIRDDQIYGTRIVGILTPTIQNKEQLLNYIKKGDNNRKTSATDFNARSSRSHSILQLKLKITDMNNRTEQYSTLSLCDLAGSEKATSSIERRKEGSYINKSLLALSTVINKLSVISSGNGSPTSIEHIPYRDSKLTRLLQPALSGASLVLILCTIHLGSPTGNAGDQQFVSETYNTLRFAARAKHIIMNVQENKSSNFGENESVIEEMRKIIDTQRHELNKLRLNTPGATNISNSPMNLEKMTQLEAENKVLNEKIEHLTRLTDLQKTETVILKNHSLNDLLGMGIERNSLQMMMANLENFYKRVHYEMEEYKTYTSRLENQIKTLQVQKLNYENSESIVRDFQGGITDKHMEAALKDQEGEIWHLKELLKDKELIIRSLTKTSKLRRLVDSNSMNSAGSDEVKEKKLAAGIPLASIDKENMLSGSFRNHN